MTKKKPHKIVLTLEEDFDFESFGICSHHPDYRVAFSINEKLNIKLSKSEQDFIPDIKKGTPGSFSSFEYINEELGAFYLVKNNSLGKHLIPEKPLMDYFLFINQLNGVNPKSIVQKINTISFVLGTYHFEPEEVPSTQFIHLDF